MSEKSAIEWTDATWNPTTGCTKVSPACAHCYIERTPPFRVRGRKFVDGHIPVELHPDRLDTPLRRKKPTVYFVNSLSDLFHEDIPDAFIDRVFAVMALAPQHTFQILTKRAERMREYMTRPDKAVSRRFLVADAMEASQFKHAESAAWSVRHGLKLGDEPGKPRWPLPNVWLGVSVENQHFADARIPLLLQTPAAIRFISAEPLLGPVSLARFVRPFANPLAGCVSIDGEWWHAPGSCVHCRPALDWVIVGGESGPILRPTDPVWVRSVRDQCNAAGVAFFFKQWGGKTAKAGGRTLDGRTWDEMPTVAAGTAMDARPTPVETGKA